MSGFIRFLGFALPVILAFDLDKNPPRYGTPMPGRCCLCKRQRPKTYGRGDGQRVCSIDIEETVRVQHKARHRAAPRPIALNPSETLPERQPLDPWWDRWFG